MLFGMDDLAQTLREFAPIDTHFHYFHCMDQGQDSKADVEFAFKHGLRAAVEAGTPHYSFDKRKELSLSYPHLYLICGHHPQDCIDPAAIDTAALKEELAFEKTIALGEVGLDYMREVNKKAQQECFIIQLNLSKEMNKPVVLHVREAHEDALAIIREQDIHHGIVHCFTGDKNIARAWLDQGFYLSYSGIATFKNAPEVQESVLYTPLERLLCETDAPFLTPVPYRGRPNQLGYVAFVYRHISSLRGIKGQIFSQQMAANFKKFVPQF